METPREIFLNAAATIAESLAPLGYKFAKSGPHTQKKVGDFVFRICFQSSHKNVAGTEVALWIHANVLSKRLMEWRASQPHPLWRNDYAAGGQVGNLQKPHKWCEWNLACAGNREQMVQDAVAFVHQVAVPFFTQFDDVPSLCRQFEEEGELPGTHISHIVEFLLCFAGKESAQRAMNKFLSNRVDIHPTYYEELRRMREQGLPRVNRTGFAHELAFLTVSYGLIPPDF